MGKVELHDLELIQTKDVKQGYQNGNFIPVWRDWDKIYEKEPGTHFKALYWDFNATLQCRQEDEVDVIGNNVFGREISFTKNLKIHFIGDNF